MRKVWKRGRSSGASGRCRRPLVQIGVVGLVDHLRAAHSSEPLNFGGFWRTLSRRNKNNTPATPPVTNWGDNTRRTSKWSKPTRNLWLFNWKFKVQHWLYVDSSKVGTFGAQKLLLKFYDENILRKNQMNITRFALLSMIINKNI